jgi:hypothetical protein
VEVLVGGWSSGCGLARQVEEVLPGLRMRRRKEKRK